jgi:hypothetical protein
MRGKASAAWWCIDQPLRSAAPNARIKDRRNRQAKKGAERKLGDRIYAPAADMRQQHTDQLGARRKSKASSGNRPRVHCLVVSERERRQVLPGRLPPDRLRLPQRVGGRCGRLEPRGRKKRAYASAEARRPVASPTHPRSAEPRVHRRSRSRYWAPQWMLFPSHPPRDSVAQGAAARARICSSQAAATSALRSGVPSRGSPRAAGPRAGPILRGPPPSSGAARSWWPDR